MLQLSNTLLNKPVLSLRTGTPVAVVTEPIINPDSLKIEGFYCEDRFNHARLVLLCQDIRDFIRQGFVINDHDVLANPEELIRLKSLMHLHFVLINKPIITVSKSKVGKVSDYATDISSMYIQKLYVSQSILKSFTGGSLSIDRSQVIEITRDKIIIADLAAKVRANANAMA